MPEQPVPESDPAAFKQRQRAIWSAGDYHAVSRPIQAVADLLVERAGVDSDDEVLDVATGTGNVAVRAAALGASVTGLDLTPELLDVARARAQEEGLEIAWRAGDAESLPFPADSFDAVLSCFGVIFAPRQEVAASELARVGRPGATVALASWTPEGLNGRMFTTIARHMPPPPAGARSPIEWGSEERVRSLLADSTSELSFQRSTVEFAHDSPESWVDHNADLLGPLVMARAALGEGWQALRGDLIEMYEDANEADDGSLLVSSEYLLTLGRIA